jgi:hypothetical protein
LKIIGRDKDIREVGCKVAVFFIFTKESTGAAVQVKGYLVA